MLSHSLSILTLTSIFPFVPRASNLKSCMEERNQWLGMRPLLKNKHMVATLNSCLTFEKLWASLASWHFGKACQNTVDFSSRHEVSQTDLFLWCFLLRFKAEGAQIVCITWLPPIVDVVQPKLYIACSPPAYFILTGGTNNLLLVKPTNMPVGTCVEGVLVPKHNRYAILAICFRSFDVRKSDLTFLRTICNVGWPSQTWQLFLQ